MEQRTAEIIFFAVVPVLLLVWLAGTRFALSRTRRPALEEQEPWPGPASEAGAGERDGIAGEVVVRGDAEPISRKVAGDLAAGTLFRDGSDARIIERTRDRVVFERLFGGRRPRSLPGGSGRMTFRQEGGRTRVRYALSGGNGSLFRLIALLVCFGYGGLIVAGVPLAIWLLVVRSEDPAVRAQTVQVVQMVHGVWPPFLIGGIFGKMRKRIGDRLETYLANLEHLV